MLFVIFGHLIPEQTGYFVFTSPIKIPLFFAITGYVFNDRGGNQRGFFKTLFFRLIIPWFALSLLPVALISFREGIHYFAEAVIDTLTGERAWYMPCCVLAEIIFFYIRKHCSRVGTVSCWCGLCCIAGLCLARWNVGNLFMFNRALIVQAYILIGFIFREKEAYLCEKPGRFILPGGVLYFALAFLTLRLFPNQCLDVHMNRYYNIPICLAMIVIGCFGAMIIAKRMRRFPALLVFIGQNTLVYYIWSGYATAVVERCAEFAGIGINRGAFLLVEFVLICMICGVCAVIINRFAPEMVGKKRDREESHGAHSTSK